MLTADSRCGLNWLIEWRFTSHPTQNKSVRGRPSQPVSWFSTEKSSCGRSAAGRSFICWHNAAWIRVVSSVDVIETSSAFWRHSWVVVGCARAPANVDVYVIVGPLSPIVTITPWPRSPCELWSSAQ